MAVFRRWLFTALGLGLLVGLVACSSTGSTGSLGSGGAPATPAIQSASPTPGTTVSSSRPRHAAHHKPRHRNSAAPDASQAAQAAAASGCYPLSDEGTCYLPGEYCRDDDHGMTGRTASDEAITCEDNDGWRWEPAGGTSPVAASSPRPASSPTPAGSCYPLSDEGTCYLPGEFCRDDDHGVAGRTASGESITCEDNDGWRWEPA